MTTTKTRRGPWRWLRRTLATLLLLALLVFTAGWIGLRASLPQLDGTVRVTGLRGTVSALRDAEGVPVIRGETRDDVAWATGYLHAQDRYFQMDLLRRAAAGELAALIGSVALPVDRETRVHRFRHRADAALETLSAEDRALLQRYADGVNAGLGALGARPFEYALLRSRPEPWQPADTLLVIWAMYLDLQDGLLSRELSRGWLREHATPEQLAFLLPATSTWDAPLDAPDTAVDEAPIPAQAPAGFGKAGDKPSRLAAIEALAGIGSNNWAVAGTRTTDGMAIVADDMHLGLRLPNIWYRAALEFGEADGHARRIVGVTLPGAPLVIAGDNGHLAWGFTNSYGDYLDLVDAGPDDDTPLRAGGATLDVQAIEETIAVRGGRAETLRVEDTALGPVRRLGGRRYVQHWLAYAPGAANLGFCAMEDADTLPQAFAAVHGAGIPSQNLVIGDEHGHIGWTIAGLLPDHDADATRSLPLPPDAPLWQGLRAPADYPQLVDPADGQLWTANNRQLAGADYRLIGDGGADLGARARQIRDDLSALGAKTDIDGVYGVVLDDRALFLAPWRERALRLLDEAALAAVPARSELRRVLAEQWQGRASVDSASYRIVRGWLYGLYDDCFGGIDAQLAVYGKRAGYGAANPRWSLVLGRLIDANPEGWQCRGRDLHAASLAVLDRVAAELTAKGQPLAAATWGKRNVAAIAHPFASILPVLRPWLAAPADELAGDQHMPRVAAPGFGPSERLVMVPGHAERSRFAMPGGQSGHPLSPYFLAGHARWVRGETGPLLPGPAQHTLDFIPASAGSQQ